MRENLEYEEMKKIMFRAYGYHKALLDSKISGEIRKKAKELDLDNIYVSTYIERCIEKMNSYLNYANTLTQFRIDNRITTSGWSDIVDTIRILDPKKFSDYCIKKAMEDEFIVEQVENTKDVMYDMIRRGIVSGFYIRDFDSIDYYTIAKIPMDDYILEVKKMPSSDMQRTLNMFFKKRNDRILKGELVNDFLKLKTVIGKREITEEEKLDMLYYFHQNNIPLTVATKKDGLHRIIDDNLRDQIDAKVYKKKWNL